MNEKKKVAVMLADHHMMMLEGLRLLFTEHTDDIEIVGHAQDYETAVTLSAQLKPDVVVAEPYIFDDGVNCFCQMTNLNMNGGLIALASGVNRQMIEQAAKAGVSGFVLKKSRFMELVDAIRTVCQKEKYMCSNIRGFLAEECRNELFTDNGKGTRLDSNENEIVRLIATGITSKQIAQKLGKSPKTIDAKRRKIMDKLEIDSIAELVKHAIRHGLVHLHEPDDESIA
jgi:two-component system NarL family response regulator